MTALRIPLYDLKWIQNTFVFHCPLARWEVTFLLKKYRFVDIVIALARKRKSSATPVLSTQIGFSPCNEYKVRNRIYENPMYQVVRKTARNVLSNNNIMGYDLLIVVMERFFTNKEFTSLKASDVVAYPLFVFFQAWILSIYHCPWIQVFWAAPYFWRCSEQVSANNERFSWNSVSGSDLSDFQSASLKKKLVLWN